MKRYSTDDPKYDAYTNKYVNLKNSSQILGSSIKGISFAAILYDENNLEGVKIELIGEPTSGQEGKASFEKGEYVRKGTTYTARIPMLKQELREWNLMWKHQQLQAQEQGKEIPSFDECPVNMLEKKLILEAQIDVAAEELEAVNKKLKEYTDKVEEADSRDVLKYGLQQVSFLRDGTISEIDFQNVSKVNGVLCIDDKRSPYHLLSVVSYRELAVQWLETMRIKDAEILKTMQEKAKKEGNVIPRYFSRCHGSVRVNKNLLPACPEIEETSTVPKRQKRTK